MPPANRRAMRWLMPLALAALLAGVMPGCRQERKVDVGNLDSHSLPTMRTTNVNTIISDSGIVQYRIVSPLWLMYENVDTPYWRFPKGLYLRRFDRFHNVIATVAADSAVYFKNRRLWRLDGRVEITRVPRDLFQTEQLFWDEKGHLLYTEKFIHIENATHMLEGDGFRSDDRLERYTIVKPKGIFPLDAAPGTMPAGGRPSQEATRQQTVIDLSANP